jgi:4-aminobutyrate aminotransferase-like enzyme
VSTNKELQAIRDAATPQGVGIQTKVYADKAKNAEIWDVEGNRYIDLAVGIAVCNTGHNHPDVVNAIFTRRLRVFCRSSGISATSISSY